jgi:hypothetical protein
LDGLVRGVASVGLEDLTDCCVEFVLVLIDPFCIRIESNVLNPNLNDCLLLAMPHNQLPIDVIHWVVDRDTNHEVRVTPIFLKKLRCYADLVPKTSV